MSMEKGFIICIDDQPEIVDVLLMQLENAVGHTCEIETAESADEALEVLFELEKVGGVIELVITDEIMPGLQGSKFLEIVHQHDPDIMTMLLTGQAGLDDVVYAVNHAGLAKCLKKPWEYEDLKRMVLELIEKARMNRWNKRLAQEVVAEKNKAEAIVHSITDGILVTDRENRISLVNEACVNILRRPEADLLGTRILDVLELKELILLLAEASQRSGDAVSNEIVLKNSEEVNLNRYIVAVARTLRDRNGNPLGVVTVLRDVTKEKEISAMKDNFLSTVSHELRTPLTSILSTLELLLQNRLGDLNKDQREFISTSKEQGEFLSEMIKNLIDLSALESHQMELMKKPIDIQTVAVDISSLTKELARAKGLKFFLEVEPNLPQIIANKERIEQMLKILLSNAVKFTKQGEIRLKVQRYPEEGIQVSVSDTGIGITHDHLEKIFEKFFQVDNSSTREFGGPGIGLSICKAIVHAHKGCLWVESELNKGTTFHVMLPLNPRTSANADVSVRREACINL
jgi:PAS domain S-box-containing protein